MRRPMAHIEADYNRANRRDPNRRRQANRSDKPLVTV